MPTEILQILQPFSDIGNVGWDITPPSPDPAPGKVWPAINGTVATDASYVTSTAVGNAFLVRLTPGVTPGRGVNAPGYPVLVVRRRRRTISDSKSMLRAAILRGSFEVAVRYIPVASTLFDPDYTDYLTPEEAILLDDLSDIRLKIETVQAIPCDACPGGVAPPKFKAEMGTVTNNTCNTCSALGGTKILEVPPLATGCIYSVDTTSQCTMEGIDKIFLVPETSQWAINIGPALNQTIMRYFCPISLFSCSKLSTFYAQEDHACNWPDEVTVEPYH